MAKVRDPGPSSVEIADRMRRTELDALRHAYSNGPEFLALEKVDQDRLVSITELALCQTALERYLHHHSVTNWKDVQMQDVYDSLGAKILYNLDLESNLNREWYGQHPSITLLGRCVMGYQLRQMVVGGLERKTAREVWALISHQLSDHGNLWTDPERLPEMTCSELNPELNRKYLLKKEERGNVVLECRTSEMYTCRKCGQRRTKVYTKQTRGLDEQVTVLIKCMNCQSQWT
jgi:DNA-directed RNA polymerase subunit M/transcription elongation factor TFIIS